MNRRAFHKDVRGSAAAEFALILPLMLVLVFSFYEAGRVFWSYNIVQSSARDAARYAGRLAVTCTGSSGAFDDAGSEAAIQNLARTGTVDGSGDPLVPNWTDNSTVTVTIDCSYDNSAQTMKGLYTSHANIPTITVTAAAPYGLLFGGLFGGLDIPAVTVSNAQVWTE
jgi:Flp pilus assembly protein TadG